MLSSSIHNRREFLKILTGGIPATIAFSEGNFARAKFNQKSKPNIILLLTDDQRWDALGCAGNPIVQTPQIDELAREGVRFTNAFVTSSICAASRASIFTGTYERFHGCNFNTGPLSQTHFEQSYPVLLRHAGYRTGFIGKFGVALGPHPPERSYEDWDCKLWVKYEAKLPINQFDVWHGFKGQGDFFPEGKSGRHLTEIMASQAIEFLKGCSHDQPFCLSISFKAPHSPFEPDPAFDDLYADANIPLPRTADWKYFDRLPDCVKTGNAHAHGYGYWQRRYGTPELYQQTMKQYYRLITGVDTAVGKIRQALKTLHLEHNTVIIFLSDNGDLQSDHMLGGKELLYEESIRIPLIIYDPRLDQHERNRQCPELTLNLDMAPTILSLAGCPVPKTIQGRSLLPLVNNNNKIPWREDFFCENRFCFDTPTNKQHYPMIEGIRTKKWKYILYSNQTPIVEELFDLETDPHEIENLASAKKYQRILHKLRKRCKEMLQHAAGSP